MKGYVNYDCQIIVYCVHERVIKFNLVAFKVACSLMLHKI